MSLVFQQQRSVERQMLDAIGEAVLATDADGHVTYTNQAADDAFGGTADELLGMSVTDLLAPTASRRELQEIAEAIMEGRSWTGVLTGRRLDGSTFPHRVTLAPCFDEAGAIVGHGRRGPGHHPRGVGLGQGPGQRGALPSGLRREPGRHGRRDASTCASSGRTRRWSGSSATRRRSWPARPWRSSRTPTTCRRTSRGPDGCCRATPRPIRSRSASSARTVRSWWVGSRARSSGTTTASRCTASARSRT